MPLFALKIFKFLNSVILLSLRFLLGLLPILIFQYVKELKYKVDPNPTQRVEAATNPYTEKMFRLRTCRPIRQHLNV